MKRRTIVYVMNRKTTDAQINEAAEAAAQDQNHLHCLLLAALPSLPTYFYGGTAYGGVILPDNWSDIVANGKNELVERVDEVEKLLAKSAVSGDVQSAMCVSVDIKHHVARAARVSDEVHFAPNLRDTPEFFYEAAAGVLFHTPVGFRVNGAADLKCERVFIAWNSSDAAASAVHAALPYLKEAKEVVIACIDPVVTAEKDGQDPGTDVAAWLSHHGCNVTVSQFPSGGRNTARCIQDHANEFGADLVVMGAYGHARMIQTVFGGTTQSMLEQTDLPVLFAH
ncbi:universal stress protein [uncultured Sulfitobacter sp.]|uniref:universal stress protein n=1 Tax=uncultured Sulfitobacter sp. TaxID=191468 RepID=UPI0026311786|nr:universal stress protein [uncultured Sulfitobacter sp.]